MSIYSIWESRFPAEMADEGVRVTKAIWRDMLSFDGYLAHELIQDLGQPGHLFVISRWASREAADHATHPNAEQANELASEPRRRTLGTTLRSYAALVVALGNAILAAEGFRWSNKANLDMMVELIDRSLTR